MIRTIEFRLYPNQSQGKALRRWLRLCCWVFNRALEQRIKAYRRRGESLNLYDQCRLLTGWRERMLCVRSVPVGFERDALRRVDRGMKAFFRRVKAGKKPGFPRFRSQHRYCSLEYLASGIYIQNGKIRIPNLGWLTCRGRALSEGIQRGLRVLLRPSGWYAQIILDDGNPAVENRPVETAIGVDVGLVKFATLSDGTGIPNPRWLRNTQRELTALQRRVARRRKGSRRRRKAVNRLALAYEHMGLRRRNFCHEHSTELVRKYDLIAVEKLNLLGMTRSRLGKSILDAAWGQFISQLMYKAECAGRTLVQVDPRGTSQECPNCGRVVPKQLSERWHSCGCGYECERDHAAAQVILARALGAPGATRAWRDPTSVGGTLPLAKSPRRIAQTWCFK